MAYRVTPLYIAPLSRYRKPKAPATIFAKVLFPVDEQPSTAIIISGMFMIQK
jgi:hypothetical protein